MGKACLVACVLAGCAADSQPSPSARDYFAQSVHPVLAQSCASNTACHGSSGIPPTLNGDADAVYSALVPAYTGGFASSAILLPAQHAGGTFSPTVRAQIDEWFARERGE